MTSTSLERKYHLAKEYKIPLQFIFKKNREWKTFSFFFENGESLAEAFSNIKNEDSIKLRKGDKADMLESIATYYYMKISKNMENIKEFYSIIDEVENTPEEIFLKRKWDILIDKTNRDFEEAVKIFEKINKLKEGKKLPIPIITDIERTIYIEDKRNYEVSCESGNIIFDELIATDKIQYILYKQNNENIILKSYEGAEVIQFEKYYPKLYDEDIKNKIFFYYLTPLKKIIVIVFDLDEAKLNVKSRNIDYPLLKEELLKSFQNNVSFPIIDVDGSSGYFDINFPDYDEYKFYFIITTKKFPNRLFYIEEDYSARHSKSTDVRFRFRKIPSDEKVITFKFERIRGDKYRIEFSSDDYDYIEEFIGVLSGFVDIYQQQIQELDYIFTAFLKYNIMAMFSPDVSFSTLEIEATYIVTNIKDLKKRQKTPTRSDKDLIFSFKISEAKGGYKIVMLEGDVLDMKKLIFSNEDILIYKKSSEKDIVDSKLDNLRFKDEVLFGGSYQNKCQCEKQPIPIDVEDIEIWSQIRNVVEYPPGKNNYYACPEGDIPEFYLALNAGNDDFNIRPQLPCCGKTVDEKLNDFLRDYEKIMEDPENYAFTEKKRVRNVIVKTMGELEDTQEGELSNIMLSLFFNKIEEGRKIMRYGIGKDNNSFLTCLNKALSKNYTRKDIYEKVNVNLLRQEFYDKTEEQITEYFLNEEYDFSSDYFLLALEYYYNINIFVFIIERGIKTIPYLEIPNHILFHARQIKKEEPCIIILKHKKSKTYELLYREVSVGVREFIFNKKYTSSIKNMYDNKGFRFLKYDLGERKQISESINIMLISFTRYSENEVVSQHIDNSGKMYAWDVFNKEYNKIYTIYSFPSKPLNVKISNNIYREKKEFFRKIYENLPPNYLLFEKEEGLYLYTVPFDENPGRKISDEDAVYFFPTSDKNGKQMNFLGISKNYELEKNAEIKIEGIDKFKKVKKDADIILQICIWKWREQEIPLDEWFRKNVIKTDKYPSPLSFIPKRLNEELDLEKLNSDIFKKNKIYLYNELHTNMFRYLKFLERRTGFVEKNKIIKNNYNYKYDYVLYKNNNIFTHLEEFKFVNTKDIQFKNTVDRLERDLYLMNISEPNGGTTLYIIRNVKEGPENIYRALDVSLVWYESSIVSQDKTIMAMGKPYIERYDNLGTKIVESGGKYGYKIFKYNEEKNTFDIDKTIKSKDPSSNYPYLTILKYDRVEEYAAILDINPF